MKIADGEENRKIRPWIINFSHFPFYCSDDSNPTCDSHDNSFKKLDDIIHKYNVDLFINAHVHKYERTYPVYQKRSYWETSKNSTKATGEIYRNPRATIFVTEGLPGNDKSFDKDYLPKDWSKIVSNIKGYGVLNVINETSLYYERTNSADGTIVDNFMI